MARYAVVDKKSDIVLNIVVWDGKTPWSPPDGCEAKPCDGVHVDLDWLWNKGAPRNPVKDT